MWPILDRLSNVNFKIPISILISYIDRQRRQHVEKIRFQWPDYMSRYNMFYLQVLSMEIRA